MATDPNFTGIPVVGTANPSAIADPSLTAPAHTVALLMGQGPRQVTDGVLNSNTAASSTSINAGTGDIGRPISDSAGGIPGGTVISNVGANAGTTSITLSQPATATGGSKTLTLGGGVGTLITELMWIPNTNNTNTVAGALTAFLQDPAGAFHLFDVATVPVEAPLVSSPLGATDFVKSPYSNAWLPPGWSLVFTSTVANQLVTVIALGLNA